MSTDAHKSLIHALVPIIDEAKILGQGAKINLENPFVTRADDGGTEEIRFPVCQDGAKVGHVTFKQTSIDEIDIPLWSDLSITLSQEPCASPKGFSYSLAKEDFSIENRINVVTVSSLTGEKVAGTEVRTRGVCDWEVRHNNMDPVRDAEKIEGYRRAAIVKRVKKELAHQHG